MKRIGILISVTALIAFAISCSQQIEPTAQFAKSSVSFAATSSIASVSTSAKDSLTSVISFSWNDPKYAVGLSQSMFTIMVSPTGTNFANFASKSFTGVLTGSLLGKEINGMALKLGGIIGQTITLDTKVVASLTNNNEQINSNVLQITVSPYGDLMLSASATHVVATAANSSQVGTVFTWSTAFNGYSGVKMYQFQYASAGTNFSSPTSSSPTSFTQSFTQLDLNKIALALGTSPGAVGYIDFRIKASNESGDALYSNVVHDTITTYVAYNSVGIIGDATPGGWNNDVDMYRPDPVNSPSNWTVIVHLTTGLSAKFRADDAWTNNWGDTGWPSGIGAENGSNIPVTGPSGYYQVNFNAGTGAYTFTALTIPVYSQISVIGDATPGGWNTDTELTQSTSNNQVWTGTVALTAGGNVKFRANNDWGTNWGPGTASPTGLSGWGVENGNNIPITTSGNYFVYINAASGEYLIGSVDNNPGAGTPYNQIGIIGDGTPGGWNTDTYLIQDPANPYKWSAKVQLTAASAKFRANTDWTINWGAAAFPNGIGNQNGANIPVTAGNPQITFNSATGEYTFTY